MRQKGRACVGSQSPQARLTEDQVIQIIAAYLSGEKTQRELADAYAVSTITIHDILKGKTWKQLGVNLSKVEAVKAKRLKKGNPRLTPEQTQEIRNMADAKSKTRKEMAQQFGVHPDTIARIIRYETWA